MEFAAESSEIETNDNDTLDGNVLCMDIDDNVLNKENVTSVSGSSFGRWSFDKRSRKRVYVSLTGKKLTGPKALLEYKKDRRKLADSQTSRKKLVQLTAAFDKLLQSGELSSALELGLLSGWGLPSKTLRRYASKGVTSLFEWQAECLLVDGAKALRGGNLVYTAPTSGGKTLVAEVLMLRRLAARQPGTVLFVVPFIALAEVRYSTVHYTNCICYSLLLLLLL
jgi:superfamily II helicase